MATTLSETPGPNAHVELMMAIQQYKSPQQPQLELKQDMMNVIIDSSTAKTSEPTNPTISSNDSISFTPTRTSSNDSIINVEVDDAEVDDVAVLESQSETELNSSDHNMSANESLLTVCGICYDIVDTSSSIPPCLHQQNQCPNFACCDSCTMTYLRTKVKDHTVGPTQLTCPGNCGESLTPEDVRNIMKHYSEHDLLKEYETLLTEYNEMGNNKNQRLNRLLPSLSDMKSSIEFQMWSVGKNIQRCNGCHMVIEKNGGCNHMTCRHCRHQFYWCCGQSYGKHNKLICIPKQYINHRSKFWGPILPIRALTKTIVVGVGISIVPPVAVVGGLSLGLYVTGRKISKKSGFNNWQRRRQQARAERARIRRQEERIRQLEIERESERLQRVKDLSNIEILLKRYNLGVMVKDSSIKMLSKLKYKHPQVCPMCSLLFSNPLENAHHLVMLHMDNGLNQYKAADQEENQKDYIFEFIEQHLLTSELYEVNQNNNGSSCQWLIQTENNSEATRHRREIDNTDQVTMSHSNVPQRCQCGMEFDNIREWCIHMVDHNRNVVENTIKEPQACLVTISPGHLCPCRVCNEVAKDDDGSPAAFCSECNHPRMLHSDNIRSHKSKINHWQ